MTVPLLKNILQGIICTIILCPAFLYAQNQNRVVDAQGNEQLLYRQSHALLIGASDYTAGWPPLPGVKDDISAIEKILKKHNFTITKVLNPDSRKLDNAFDEFIHQHGLDEENRLLFYLAGHGYTTKKKYGEDMGYIIPVDAPSPHEDIKGFLRKAMPIQRVELFAKKVDSKHALFIFDSCFSGSIFSVTRAIPASITDKTSKPVRQFITSGSADEEVPDISIFRQQFVAALSGEGDTNGDSYLTGSELGLFLDDNVVNYSNNTQHPQYGKIRNPHLDKGDFVFILPQKKSAKTQGKATKNDTQKAAGALDGANREITGQAELMFWDTIKNSSNPADFKAYLEQYPQGKFAGLAKIRSRNTAAETQKAEKAARLAQELEETKKAEKARIAREQEAARKKTEEARIAKEQEAARKRAEEARIAKEQEAARKRAEEARIAEEEKRNKKKKRRIISTF
ncbi:MAG: hypothetical protein D3910_07665 [Candidatus Electrothrix sp. ATG2]|nr:hypothetical protein [Candidatus Electrothrix sp. ATG2]